MGVSIIDLVIMIAYFIGILAIGYYSMKAITGFDDYAVAGRNIPMSLLFATVGATLLGGGATIGRVAFVHNTGLVVFVAVLGVATSQILIGLFIAPRVREMGNVYTIGDIMGYHFGQSGRLVSSIISFIYCICVFAVQILAMGRILETVTGLPILPMSILATIIVIAYTWGGGILAVIYTDAVQFIILMLGIGVAALISLSNSGGMTIVLEQVASIKPDNLVLDAGWSLLALIAFFLTFLLGEALAPFHMQRYMTTKSSKDAKLGVTIFGVFLV
ncbi:MAG: sodium:solute symporter family protein [Peptococcales bacterium]|jgi:SSS family solute:Na+ symporter